jgi:hypothetical protein
MAEGRVVGFGDDVFSVQVIPRQQAVDTIRRHHYSGRIVNNSYVHLGVYYGGAYLGALQFGYALNPAGGGKVVAGTGNREYLERNRMWLDDRVPRNGESKAIAYAVRVIRQHYPSVGWLQSFAENGVAAGARSIRPPTSSIAAATARASGGWMATGTTTCCGPLKARAVAVPAIFGSVWPRPRLMSSGSSAMSSSSSQPFASGCGCRCCHTLSPRAARGDSRRSGAARVPKVTARDKAAHHSSSEHDGTNWTRSNCKTGRCQLQNKRIKAISH